MTNSSDVNLIELSKGTVKVSVLTHLLHMTLADILLIC